MQQQGTRMKAGAVIIAVGALAAGIVAPAFAQTYPVKAVRMIVPLSPGGAVDVAGRLVARSLSERWGAQVVVENRPGAGGTVGTAVAARAAPDGYTLLMGSSTLMSVNPHLYQKLTYDTVRDFTPVALVASTPLLLVVHPSVPVRNLKQFVAFAKGQPGALNYSSSGNGSTGHLAGEMFRRATGTNIVHVPHSGSAPALVSLMSGETQMMFPAISAALSQARSGRLRALAVTSQRRVDAAPELPTVAEAGVPGFDVEIWSGVFMPANVPRELVTRVHADLMDQLKQPALRKAFIEQGASVVTRDTPEQFASYVKAEWAKWGRAVKESGAQID
jgi:tripartite-type tricarboxylate transporter receptor subunit TctC